jgi:hypothetical protein
VHLDSVGGDFGHGVLGWGVAWMMGRKVSGSF